MDGLSLMSNKRIKNSSNQNKNDVENILRDSSLGSGSTAADILVKIQILSMPISLLIAILIPSYFNIQIARQMIFYGADSNCVIEGVAFGAHCFGDFGSLVNGINAYSNPWMDSPGATPYPPFSLIAMEIFSILSSLTKPGIALIIYLLSLVLAMVLPVWWATRKLSNYKRVLLSLIFTVATLPGLATLDRGNNLVWSLPFLYKGLNEITQGKFNRSIPFIAIALFAVLFLLGREFASFFKLAATTSVLYLLSFSYFTGFDFRETLIRYVQNLLAYGSGIPDTWPPNISLARGIKSILDLLSMTLSNQTIVLISNIFLILVISKIFLLYRKTGLLTAILTLIPTIFLLAPMTWAYYGTYLIVLIALMIAANSSVTSLGGGSKFFGVTYLLCISFTLSTLFLPFLINYENLVQFLVPILWTLHYSIYLLMPIKEANKSQFGRR
jgi:hypothetical protein